MSAKQLLKMLRLNEIETGLDRLELAADRQREIFERMRARWAEGEGDAAYIPPKDLREHAGMLEWAYDYIMTSEFEALEPEVKELIERHVREREQLVANQAAPAAPNEGLPLGLPGVEGAAPPAIGGLAPVPGLA